MMEKKDLSQYEKNLVCFLRLFQNRPFHLAKYLSDNNCFKEEFIKNISDSKRLSDLSQKYELGEIPNIYFVNFKEMIKFFENISNNYTVEGFDNEKINEELNSKLDDLIKTEKYEEAIKIRDFMIQNNIKRKSQ
jgi:protein-arginine kinase activator protein McsA